MLNQSFSLNNLRRLVVGNDLFRFDIERDKDEIDLAIEEVVEKIDTNTIDYDLFNVVERKGKKIFICEDFGVDLAVRKVNDSLKRIYKVKQADRTKIVKQICTLIKEESPKYIIKLDVKDFYESIDRDELVKKLTTDRILSFRAISILNELFNSKHLINHSGLPRGIGLSATLSELFMRDIDRKIMRMKEVYYYSRYVDDILLFSIGDPVKLKAKIEAIVSDYEINLNEKKTEIIKVECKCIKGCRCKSQVGLPQTFDHLGYQFNFFDKPQKEEQIEISISPKKMKKIKTRIVNCFLDFIRSDNFYILEKRIMFLTGTYYINKPNNDGRLKAGLRYNYCLINNKSSIDELNVFLRKNIFAKRGSYGRKIHGKLSLSQKKQLAKLCFNFGFYEGLTHNFTASDIKIIKKCWFNEKL